MMEQPQPHTQKLPAGLAGVLNGPDDNRDSAYYSIHHASKHNSTQSTNGTVTTPSTDVSSAVEKTPSPISTGPSTQPLNSPASGGMSVASMVSPTSPISSDNTINRFSQQSYESTPQSATFPHHNESRRESVDSRLGANFGDMRLANSPYASQNQSTTSLQTSLAQQRNPGSAVERHSGSIRFSNGYQPQRNPDTLSPRMATSRTAPVISGPALHTIARAPEPTKGQAWAFPEEEVQRLPSAARPSGETQSRQGTSFYDDSRRNSYAESIASSQYTTESRLPIGQRRLEDGMPSDYRVSRTSSDFQGVSTHHHSLQHRQLSELQDEETSPGGSQPYSRTPELRVSHKLAERKRRTEMKELFDTLNSRQHHDRGTKASKWEILTKAIAEDERKESLIKAQQDEIQRYKSELQRKDHDLDTCQRELNNLRLENAQYRAELNAHNSYQNGPSAPHTLQAPLHAPAINGYGSGHFEQRPSTQPDPRQQHPVSTYSQRPTELPPLRGINGPAPEAMSGVQYQQHDSRSNGYRVGSDRY